MKSRRLTPWITFLALLAVFAWATFVEYGIKATSPDGALYIAIADLLFDQGLYEDWLRHDEILPSVGHPVLLGLLWKAFGSYVAVYAASFVVLAGLLSWMLGRVHPLWVVPVVIAAALFCDAQFAYMAQGGVESSMILATGLVCGSIVIFVKAPNWRTMLLFSIAVTLSCLVRPMLVPVAPVLIAGTLAYGFWHGMRGGLLSICVGLVFWLGVWGVSEYTHGDSRMVTGTYGAQGLYPAFNSHIDLTRNYYSGLWRQLGAEEGLRPYENVAGWEERSQRLQKLVIDFVLKHPDRAWDGFVFRLSRYTWNAEASGLNLRGIPTYRAVLIITLMSGIMILWQQTWRSREFFALLTLWAFFFYMTIINSFFVYAGPRYVLTNWAILLFIAAWTARMIAKPVQTTFDSDSDGITQIDNRYYRKRGSETPTTSTHRLP